MFCGEEGGEEGRLLTERKDTDSIGHNQMPPILQHLSVEPSLAPSLLAHPTRSRNKKVMNDPHGSS